jgi:thiol-disulfide isomerase/thioredoxin
MDGDVPPKTSRTPPVSASQNRGAILHLQAKAAGLWSGVPVGLSLGLIWTPCVGPIMASVISLAVTQRIDGGSVFITLAYTLGTSIPMLAVMLGGRVLLNRVPALVRNAAAIQKGFGVLMILVGVAVGLGWDRRFQAAVLAALPGYGAGLTALEEAAPVRDALQARDSAGGAEESLGSGAAPLMTSVRPSDAVFAGAPQERPEGGVPGDFGLAPPLVAGGPWFNTDGNAPLTLEGLRGKVVLVDFWTYSCINCVRTIPYLKAWYETYRDRGLVIIGVHTPEFAFEKSPDNVQRAMRDLGVDWPVVLDNDYRQWRAYRNLYWPAHYFIDAEGRVRYFHFGEGRYEESERVIQALLKEAGMKVGGLVSKADPRFTSRTPETYLGYRRAKGFASAVAPARDKAADYRPAGVPGSGEWSLAGTWTVTSQYVVPESSGALELGFHARNVFLVVEPEAPGGRIEVQVDGRPAADTADVKGGVLAPDGSRVYQLVGLEEPGEHVLRLEVKGRLRLFAFTFG